MMIIILFFLYMTMLMRCKLVILFPQMKMVANRF